MLRCLNFIPKARNVIEVVEDHNDSCIFRKIILAAFVEE